MFCCPNCFSDEFLRSHIIANSNKKGDCFFCKTKNTDLINPEDLLERFEPLLDLYEEEQNGLLLNKIIQSDWNVFSFPPESIQKQLLKAITNDDSLDKKKYKSKFLKEKQNIEKWEKFREELKHRNRFFPDKAIEKTDLEPFEKHIGVLIKQGSQKFFRARINNDNKPFEISKMGQPPKKKASNGRANPIGISYLYLASKIDTAISEVRGHKGETLTLAEFVNLKDLELADLRDPKNIISPFELNDEDELEIIYKNLPFLTMLGDELSKPIIPREANLEYLPSQYLCELIKLKGFHGIIYKSSISDGYNYVIFDVKKLRPIAVSQYKITDMITQSVKL